MFNENVMISTDSTMTADVIVTEFITKERIWGQGSSLGSLKRMQKAIREYQLNGYKLISHTNVVGKQGSFFFWLCRIYP